MEFKNKHVPLKDLLDRLTVTYNIPAFIETDPIQFPRRFTNLKDIEISALLTSVITWGKRNLILRDAERMHQMMRDSPYNYIMNREWEVLKDSGKNIHRTFFERDMWNICRGLYHYYLENETLESLFLTDGILSGLDKLSGLMNTRHISSPQTKSPCKRSNLMLRWLVRNDGIVDMGVWKNISPAQLIIPLDVHVARISRLIWDDLPKTERLSTALIITNHLSKLCQEDPCKYDFALFGFGEEQRRTMSGKIIL
jgi:uncharacterized protein (TIGR02757 family)